MQQLRKQRTDRTAGHDDRPFGAERATASDRNGRRQWFQDSHLWFDAAAVDQDGLDRFRDAVSTDALRAVARHGPDDQRAADRHQDFPGAEMVAGRRGEIGAPALEEEQIGKEPDQPHNPRATKALMIPMPTASSDISGRRGEVRKSPRPCAGW
jgi:hypothetical protein